MIDGEDLILEDWILEDYTYRYNRYKFFNFDLETILELIKELKPNEIVPKLEKLRELIEKEKDKMPRECNALLFNEKFD